MTSSSKSEYFELSDYLGVLRRRWIVLVAATLLGTILAGAYYVVGPKTYTASVLVQVNPLPTDSNAANGRSSNAVNMDNEAQVAQSAAVASVIKQKLRSPLTVAQISAELSVSVPPNTTFLQISCGTSTAASAEACANAAGNGYLSYRRLSALKLVTTDVNALTAQAKTLTPTVQKLKSKIAQGAYPAASAAKEAALLQAKAASASLSAIEAHINSDLPLQANLASPASTLVGVITTPAQLPGHASSPQAALILPSGLVAGLVIGLILAFYSDRRNPFIYSLADLQRVADHPTIREVTSTRRSRLTGLASSRSRAGQTFTELAQFVASALGDGNHVLAVASTASGPAGSVASANVALALARTRGDTVLVCQGPGGRLTAQLVGARDGTGFSELLTQTAILSDVTQATKLPDLRVITPGYSSAGTPLDLRHDALDSLIGGLRRRFNYVVLDVRSVGEDAAGFALTEFSDAAIVVAQVGQSRSVSVTDCVDRLDLLRTPVLALLLLPSSVRADQSFPAQPAARPHGRRGRQPAPAGAGGQFPAESAVITSESVLTSTRSMGGAPSPAGLTETTSIPDQALGSDHA